MQLSQYTANTQGGEITIIHSALLQRAICMAVAIITFLQPCLNKLRVKPCITKEYDMALASPSPLCSHTARKPGKMQWALIMPTILSPACAAICPHQTMVTTKSHISRHCSSSKTFPSLSYAFPRLPLISCQPAMLTGPFEHHRFMKLCYQQLLDHQTQRSISSWPL